MNYSFIWAFTRSSICAYVVYQIFCNILVFIFYSIKPDFYLVLARSNWLGALASHWKGLTIKNFVHRDSDHTKYLMNSEPYIALVRFHVLTREFIRTAGLQFVWFDTSHENTEHPWENMKTRAWSDYVQCSSLNCLALRYHATHESWQFELR
jgi:hypothetical protein